MKYEIKTAGEQLAYFIQDRILDRAAWNRLTDVLTCTGRSDALCDFFHQVTVINLTCRIVAAGTSLLRAAASRPARSLQDSGFEKEFLDFLRERLFVGQSLSSDLLRNALRAVESTQRDPTPKQRNTFKCWADREHRRCYLCGVSLDFTEQDPVRKFTLDHIWPQRFGGDSIEDNWLTACGSCNSRKKRDFATWAMPNVQSLILGFDPSESEYGAVEGSQRFALHQLAAKKLASQRNMSLKRAYVLLGPWESLRLIDAGDTGDFFNLAIHRVTLEVF
jgi:hypothetical protein